MAGISTRTVQRPESGETSDPPVSYLISCAKSLWLDDWHLLLEDEWAKPLPGVKWLGVRSHAHSDADS